VLRLVGVIATPLAVLEGKNIVLSSTIDVMLEDPATATARGISEEVNAVVFVAGAQLEAVFR
jgi:hypothetical protein